MLLDQGFEFVGVDVAFEGYIAVDVQCFVNEDFFDRTAIDRDVRFGGGEVLVHRHDLTFFDQRFGQQVFAGAALVCRQEIFFVENFFDLRRQFGEGFATGVAVVSGHHRRQLLIAHGIDATVGEHVQKYVAVLQ